MMVSGRTTSRTPLGGRCPSGKTVLAYNGADLHGHSVWELTGIRSMFEHGPVVAADPVYRIIARELPVGPQLTVGEALHPEHRRQLDSRPAIFTYVHGEDPGEAVAYWPVVPGSADMILDDEESVAMVGEGADKVRLLLAARDASLLESLTWLAMTGTQPLCGHSLAVRPWSEVVDDTPAWADCGAAVVDLRSSVRTGRAIVYLTLPNQNETVLKAAHEWTDETAILRAVFRPDDGAVVLAEPGPEAALHADGSGRLVYEVFPIHRAEGLRPAIRADQAFFRMGHLLPSFGNGTAAVRFILPDRWSANTPWIEQDGWYAIRMPEVRETLVGMGWLSYAHFTIGDCTFSLAQLAESKARRQEETAAFVEREIGRLASDHGLPLAGEGKSFALTVFDHGLTGSGASGLRTAVSDADERAIQQQLLAWWPVVGACVSNRW